MKRLVFDLRNALEPDRIDRVEVAEGVILRDVSDLRNRPFIPVSALVRVELVDDEADAEPTPTPVPEDSWDSSSIGVHVSVPVHVDPATSSRWGALPPSEEPPDAA